MPNIIKAVSNKQENFIIYLILDNIKINKKILFFYYIFQVHNGGTSAKQADFYYTNSN